MGATVLFVGGVQPDVTQEDLKGAFHQYTGVQVIASSIVCEPASVKCIGQAYVTVANEDMPQAMTLSQVGNNYVCVFPVLFDTWRQDAINSAAAIPNPNAAAHPNATAPITGAKRRRQETAAGPTQATAANGFPLASGANLVPLGPAGVAGAAPSNPAAPSQPGMSSPMDTKPSAAAAAPGGAAAAAAAAAAAGVGGGTEGAAQPSAAVAAGVGGGAGGAVQPPAAAAAAGDGGGTSAPKSYTQHLKYLGSYPRCAQVMTKGMNPYKTLARVLIDYAEKREYKVHVTLVRGTAAPHPAGPFRSCCRLENPSSGSTVAQAEGAELPAKKAAERDAMGALIEQLLGSGAASEGDFETAAARGKKGRSGPAADAGGAGSATAAAGGAGSTAAAGGAGSATAAAGVGGGKSGGSDTRTNKKASRTQTILRLGLYPRCADVMAALDATGTKTSCTVLLEYARRSKQQMHLEEVPGPAARDNPAAGPFRYCCCLESRGYPVAQALGPELCSKQAARQAAAAALIEQLTAAEAGGMEAFVGAAKHDGL